LRKEKRYGAKKIFAYSLTARPTCPCGCRTIFVFRNDLTKAAVTIVRVGKFNWNLAFWLPTFLTQNFMRIRCCLLELRKCTDYREVYLC